MRIRYTHNAMFKTKVALEPLKEDRTIAEFASEYKVHPNQISKWKEHFLEHMTDIFTNGYSRDDNNAVIPSLYEEIGSKTSLEMDGRMTEK